MNEDFVITIITPHGYMLYGANDVDAKLGVLAEAFGEDWFLLGIQSMEDFIGEKDEQPF